jgi:hypothetical protein
MKKYIKIYDNGDFTEIYDKSLIPENEINNFIEIETLPPLLRKEGYDNFLRLDKNKKLYWEYVPAQKEQERN